MENKDCIDVLRALYRPHSPSQCKLRLLDSVTCQNDHLTWFYTSSTSCVSTHSPHTTTVKNIIQSFVSTAQLSAPFPVPDSDLIAGTLITHNDFQVLPKPKTIAILTQRSISEVSILQQFLYPYRDLSLRYVLTYRLFNGLEVLKSYRINVNTQEKVDIKSGEICKEMEKIEREVKNAVERGYGGRVVTLTLVFLMDKSRVLWLSGSSECRIERRKDENLPFQPSISPKNRCSGDFCNFLLADPSNLPSENQNSDSVFQLFHQSTDSEHLKLALATDFLTKTRANLRSQCIEFRIPQKYVSLGKVLLSKSRLEEGKSMEMLLDFRLLRRKREGVEEVMSGVEKEGLVLPGSFYDTVKVCGRCYAVYRQLVHVLHSTKSVQSLFKPAKSQLLPVSRYLSARNSPRNLTIRSRKNSINAVKQGIETVQTTLGPINKNNIDDLLVDLRFAMEEEEQESGRIKGELRKRYKEMTQAERKKREEEKKREKEEKGVALEAKMVEKSALDADLGQLYFPSSPVLKGKIRVSRRVLRRRVGSLHGR